MNAKFLLESIAPHMSKTRILGIIQEAINDLVLLDAHQVAAALGTTHASVRGWGHKKDIGVKMTGQGKYGQRIYFPSDIEKIRGLLNSPGRSPETLEKIKVMKTMRNQGATLMEIAKNLECDISYVSRLLKNA